MSWSATTTSHGYTFVDTLANRITNGVTHWRTLQHEPQSAELRGNVIDSCLSTPAGRNRMFRILICQRPGPP